MATVYVVTAGSGDTYRIERVYLDSEQAYGFAQAYNGIAPVEPVEVEEWRAGPQRRPTTARTGARSGGRASRPASAAERCATPTRANGLTTSPSARSGGPGRHCPRPQVVRRELAGAPKIEVVGLSKEKVEEIFWDAVTQVRADLAGIPRK